MSREKEDFRPQLERVLEAFPEHELIPVQAAAKWIGINAQTFYTMKGTPVKKLDNRYYVTRIALARWLE